MNFREYLLFAFSLIISFQIYAQPKWTYRYRIDFPDSDTAYVRPFLCSVNENGRLYVISSKITDINAHNAVCRFQRCCI